MNRFVWLGLVVLGVAALWSAGWFYVAGATRAAITGLAADAEADPSLACDKLDISGFPFRFDLTCTGASIVSGDITFAMAGLKGSVLAYNPTHTLVSAQGPITIADAFTGSRSRLDFASAETSIRLKSSDFWSGLRGEGWRLARASLVATDVRWTDTLTGEALIGSASQLEAHLLDIPEQHDASAGLAALASFARLQQVNAPGFQIADAEISLEAELTGLPDDLRLLGESDVLPRWRDVGGQLRLLSLRGIAGTDFVDANGTLALDAAARPEGQIKLTSRGLVERSGALIPEEWRGLLLGDAAADGSYSQTLNLRGGFIFAGLLPLGQLPPLF